MQKIFPTVQLKNLNRADLEDFMTWAGDPIVTESLTWDAYKDEAAAQIFLQTVAEKHAWFKAIVSEGRAVGAITLSPGQGRSCCRAELGYVVAKKHWGKGFASAAARLAVRDGFKELGVQRIEALVDPENVGSIRVIENAGMVRDGLLKNYVVHRGEIRDRFIYSAVSSD